MALVASNSNNSNHGAVFSFVGSESGVARQWNLGISNTDPFVFSIGYNRTGENNPHYGIGDGWHGDDNHHARLSIDRSGNTKIRGMLYVNGTSGGISTGNAVIHAGNIGSQSVSYASSAGGVAWGNVSSKPSNIMYYQSFTLDANTMDSNSTGFTYSVNAPFTGPIARFSTGGGYDMWLGGNYGGSGNVFYIRTRNGDAGAMNPWRLLITDGNISSQSVSYASTAGSAPANGGTATALNGSNYISRGGTSGNYNTDFSNTPAGSVRHLGDDSNVANNPGGTWWFVDNYRHSNSSSIWGTQIAWGWEDNSNRLAQRNVSGGNWSGWVYYLNSGNYTSYIDAPNKAGTSYYQVNTWLQFNGTHGLYWPSYNGAHFYVNTTSSYTQFRLDGSRGGYGGIWDSYSAVHGMMYDSAGNGGVYREANGLWYFYYHIGNNCMGVGTSTTSSSYKMYVNGTIYATGDVIAYSDARKKTNIVTIDKALETVTKMRGVFYDKIDEENKGRQLGVIAQEVNEVLPEAVNYASDIDEYGVKYGNIAGLFIEAIKELNAKIAYLESQLASK
jgi:hypothetical protein